MRGRVRGKVADLYANSHDLDALLAYFLDHLPRGELVPGECTLIDYGERFALLAPDGSVFTHSPGSVWRNRRGKVTRFRLGQILELPR
jgi:hypothetical protein